MLLSLRLTETCYWTIQRKTGKKSTFCWLGPKLSYILQVINRIGRKTPWVNRSDYFVFDSSLFLLGDSSNNIYQIICAGSRTSSGMMIKSGNELGLLSIASHTALSSSLTHQVMHQNHTKHQVLNRDYTLKSNKDLSEQKIFPQKYEVNIEYLHKQYNQF